MKLKILLACSLFALQLEAQCWQSFSPGFNHSTVLNTDGRIRTIGYNVYGQIGDGTNNERHVFTLAGTSQYIAVSGGGNHTMGIRDDGTLWTWGRNVQGELGLAIAGNQNVPRQVGTDNNWTKIWAGSFNCFAQKNDGTIWSWGLNYYGQLGHPGSTPQQVGVDTDWLDISPTPNFTIGIKTNGTLWQWGNAPGGGGTTPLQIGTAQDWVMARGGDEHVIALKTDGSIWTWGNNNYGQLGNPNPNPSGSFMRRVGTDNDWSIVSAGQDHCVALKNNGSMWAWGDGAYGALGLGNGQDFNTPQMVGAATDWIMVKSHGAHNMALKSNGTLHSWGENTYGQLGVIYPNGNTPSISPCPTLLNMESFGQDEFAVFPNPARDIIEINSLRSSQIKGFRIYDQMGRAMKEGIGYVDRIDVNTLSCGLYFLELQGEGITVLKFLKQ
ncbi:T9SS type A sorting domain-containing protein [Flavobacterium sp.]|uniref:T9SS type A sorting domain-containing protein n=1 Tax=Flavobacterium sp. TaxID=239 RepID=UPI003D6BF591